jgi:HD-GYP domain-containing protein (c-di-GMP phosphodiesterase class II)
MSRIVLAYSSIPSTVVSNIVLLEGQFNYQVKQNLTFEDFLKSQSNDPSIDFLLVGIDNQTEAIKIYQAASDGHIKHPVIVVGEQAFINHGKKNVGYQSLLFEVAFENYSIELFLNKVRHIMQILKRQEHINAAYMKIRVNYIISRPICDQDIFLKISDEKFVKIFHRNTQLTPQDISKYLNKNIEYLYVKSDDFLQLANQVIDRFKKAITSQNRPKNIQVQGKIIEHSTDLVGEMIHNLGISKEVVTLTQIALNESINVVEANPGLYDLIYSIAKSGNYVYEHSLLVSYIACAVAKGLEWDSHVTRVKICLSAFLHDIAINDDEIAKAHDLNPRESLSFSEKQQADAHITKALELLKNFKDVPQDVFAVIQNHHEEIDGSGYPRKMTSKNLPLLSGLFIFSHEVVNKLYSSGYDAGMLPQFMDELSERYNTSSYKEFVKILRQNFDKKLIAA